MKKDDGEKVCKKKTAGKVRKIKTKKSDSVTSKKVENARKKTEEKRNIRTDISDEEARKILEEKYEGTNSEKSTFIPINFGNEDQAIEDIKNAIQNKKDVMFSHIEYDDYDNNLYPSSLIMWAMCPDDTSTEWMKLFKAHIFKKAWEARKVYQEGLNPKD